MSIRNALVALVIMLLVAGFAAADVRVVKQTHQDGFTIMGQTQPPEDQEQTTWIGTDRMHMQQGDSSTIVRLDLMKLYIVNHGEQTYQVLDLPIDLGALMPEEMRPMLSMLKIEVDITPTDEYKQVGAWNARRYEMSLTSQMFSMKSTMWVTKVAGYDPQTFKSMYVHLNSLQPGMADVADEMAKVDGIVVEQAGVMTMMGSEVGTSEKALSIDEMAPPAGTYDPPGGYTEKPFDFMARMQGGP